MNWFAFKQDLEDQIIFLALVHVKIVNVLAWNDIRPFRVPYSNLRKSLLLPKAYSFIYISLPSSLIKEHVVKKQTFFHNLAEKRLKKFFAKT